MNAIVQPSVEWFSVKRALGGVALRGQARDWITDALNKNPLCLLTLDDVDYNVQFKRWRAWDILRGDRPCGAMVTEIVGGSKGHAVNVVALGGEGMKHWLPAVTSALEEYGRLNDCKYVFEMGRAGWTRALSSFGWVEGPATMLRVL